MDKLFVVVRADLPPGLQLPQSCHALRLFAAEHPEIESRWYVESNNLVVLATPDKEALTKLAYDCARDGIEVSMFREPDCDNEPTALAVGPRARKRLARYPLALAA